MGHFNTLFLMFTLNNLFLGLSDVDNEGWWVWSSDNSHLEYSNWDYPEPNGGNIENCASVSYFGPYGLLSKGRWDDSPCSVKEWPPPFHVTLRAFCQRTQG